MNTFSMNIAITINHAYVPYAYTLLLSLVAHNTPDMQIYILHRDLTDEDCNTLSSLSDLYNIHFHFICVPVSFSSVSTDTSIPEEVYFRLYLPELLPDTLERILYLDTDMVATASLQSLYTLDFNRKKAACTTGPSGNLSASVLLLNLPLLRSTMNSATSFCHNSADNSDVHCIFSACNRREDLLLLDASKYNLSVTAAFSQYDIHADALPDSVCLLHYTGEKPWHGDHLHNDLESIWWNYTKKSPYYPFLLEQTMRGMILGTNVIAYISNIQKEHQELTAIIEQYQTLFDHLSISST